MTKLTYIEAVEEWEHPLSDPPALFIAGGITGAPDWQQDFWFALDGKLRNSLIFVNPRRANFPIGDPDAAHEQIAWEHEMLNKVDAISFWFPCETLCPITLYELGAWSMTNKDIFVGAHPDYRRRTDVLEQTKLARPEIEVVDSLDALAEQVNRWMNPRLDEAHFVR